MKMEVTYNYNSAKELESIMDLTTGVITKNCIYDKLVTQSMIIITEISRQI